MNSGKPQIPSAQPGAANESLQQQLRAVGILLVTCDERGSLLARLDQNKVASNGQTADWLSALTSSAILQNHLKHATTQWSQQETPAPLQAFDGLWLAPMAMLNRRKRCGYSVAIILTQPLLQSEQFDAVCQSARLDATLCRSMLSKLPPASESDVPRLASLVRLAQEDRIRLASNSQAIESVGKQLAESYEEMNLLYTIIQSMTVQERPERFVALACQELLTTLPYAWIGTQLSDDRSRLKSLSGRLIIAGKPNEAPSNVRMAARALLRRAKAEQPIVLEPTSNPDDAEFASLGKTVVAQPVTSSGEVIGLLIAGEKRGPDTAASSVDMKLLGATATHMAIFLENAALYDDLNTMFLGTLEALTASIDAKDRYTCGHSRRVALLTQQLAHAIGLDEHTVGRMHIAGLVHDVGKIGVPETVLLKPGRLNEEEFAWIRKHPEIGYRILKDIPQLNDILPGVLHHHERWDGRGYPEGLRAEAIPLVARLIGLADAFDAMSSTRTYRSTLSRQQVFEEITRCTGTQFDPGLARTFIELDFSEFDRLVKEHKAIESAAAGAANRHERLDKRQEKAA